MPFVHAPQWPGAIADLRTDGFTVVALTPALTRRAARGHSAIAKLALLVGAEGTGLTRGRDASGDALGPHSDDAATWIR